MEWLNYHHLLYFWTVVNEGGIVPAGKVLRLSHPAISSQLRKLEESLGEPLFDRSGRRLELTETGRVVHRYADEIFKMGGELLDTVKGRQGDSRVRLRVGVTSMLPKLVVRRLLQPAMCLPQPVHLVLTEDRHERLLAGLALHELDVVLADAPVPPASTVRAYNHLLGESPIAFFATPAMAGPLREGFPASLDGAPLLMPTHGTALRRSLDRWFDGLGLRPRVVAEIQDSAVLKVFGAEGLGVFPAPGVVREAVEAQYAVAFVGETAEATERFYAITVDRKIKNPAVVAISRLAKDALAR